MWTGEKSFYDILAMAAGSSDSYTLQAFVDAFKDQYNKLDTSGFAFAPMQPGFSFEQLEKEYSINAMATYVDLNSPGTPISFEGESLSRGKIPRMKKYAAFDENQYRQQLILNSIQQDFGVNAQRTLLGAVKKLIDAHTNSLTYQRHQMVSTGKLELTENNNAGGFKATVFSATIPAANKVEKTGTARWWYDNGGSYAEGSAADPIADLKALAAAAEEKGSAFHFEVDKLTFKKTLAQTSVVKAIGYHMFPAAASDAIASNVAKNAGEEGRKAALEAIIGFPIKVIDSISRVDKYDKSKKAVVGTDVRSFTPDVWALVPDGQIGEILSVVPIKVDPQGIYADYYGGRLLMSYEYKTMLKEQRIETEMTALVVPDKPKYMWILKVTANS